MRACGSFVRSGAMRRIYLDSAPVIYLVELVQPFYARLQTFLHPSDSWWRAT